MKYIILCGGISKQIANYLPLSLPKPLNLIQGRHMIEYIIDNIPSNEIFIIYNIFLDEYNFQEILINKCKSKKLHFSQIDYLTRGAVETAFVGINKFINNISDDDNIVFIDNDNLHNIKKHIPTFENEFIGYSTHNSTHSTDLSFIKFENNQITAIEEKKMITNFYCCGFYGFKNTKNFLKYAQLLLNSNATTANAANAYYFSALYNIIIKSGENVEPFYIEETNHIGTFKDILANNYKIPKNKLRICFDLDNTLVSYPTIAGDYSSVKPIYKNCSLLKKLRDDGHEIIIYTARRMKTHNGNVGKVIKDIARVTIDTLEKFDIEYDELIFGKPIADIYIDDRSVNPYINDLSKNLSYFGLYYDTHNTKQFIPNKINNNKYNKIRRCDEYIVKTGPFDILEGELFYYQNIPNRFEHYFAKLIDYKKDTYVDAGTCVDKMIEIKIDYIEGIPLYYLYKNCLLTTKHIDELFDILDNLHSCDNDVIITDKNIKNNYIEKMKNRFNKQDYYFEDADDVFLDIIVDIETHFNSVISPVIHGDFWFSNIILTYDNTYKLVDMKGIIDGVLTLNGDIYYDYGKLYQSILGYDLILNDCDITESTTEYIKSMKSYFLKKCYAKGLNIKFLECVTKSLVFGTFPFISHLNDNIKNNIWNFIKIDIANERF
jgi:capsule biosynthesis phosphatase